ncbi:hypothetical protein Nocox_41415 [Nonomuraea coxensis DSM 45129]|uniref:Integral membrane protein n=1 Tax=Nonomuraea coxensis DSM 45129 TaxID=1122611 RepID=A0ABX8UHS1_9ACTN|nr:hypothetical protein [Nonomuraea coxensis]QYC45824.1 hypothetical protein Nocox_41415 [Nonomuraea coxensis DSM 45129]
MSSSRSPRAAWAALSRWPRRRRLAVAAATPLAAVVLGVPTALIPTPLFSRSVPPVWWNYPVLGLAAVLTAVVLATYVRTRTVADRDDATGRSLGSAGAVLSFLAVGCPVCNKAVLLLLGTSGALSYWAPLQPAVAVLSLALLAEAALRRLATEAACPVPSAA